MPAASSAMRSDTVPLTTAMPWRQPCIGGEPLLELRDLRPVEPSPVAAAQGREQAFLFRSPNTGHAVKGPGADGCASEERECVHACEPEIQVQALTGAARFSGGLRGSAGFAPQTMGNPAKTWQSMAEPSGNPSRSREGVSCV